MYMPILGFHKIRRAGANSSWGTGIISDRVMGGRVRAGIRPKIVLERKHIKQVLPKPTLPRIPTIGAAKERF